MNARVAISLAGVLLPLVSSLASGEPLTAAPVPNARSPGGLPASADLPGPSPYAGLVLEAALRFGLPAAWVNAVMRIESGGDPRARSHAGAQGLMQIMPATWAMLSQQLDLGVDPYEPRANIFAGAAYLRALVDRYGDLQTALAAYNAGPGRADAWRLQGASLPAETVSYVARIMARLGQIPSRTSAAPARSWRNAALFATPSKGINDPGTMPDPPPDHGPIPKQAAILVPAAATRTTHAASGLFASALREPSQ